MMDLNSMLFRVFNCANYTGFFCIKYLLVNQDNNGTEYKKKIWNCCDERSES